jgi:putative transposase
LCGAAYGERSTGRTNQRNGYRRRQFDTRTGTLDLAIPKLRHSSYFPDWLLERRKRAERALTTAVATCYLLGVPDNPLPRCVSPPPNSTPTSPTICGCAMRGTPIP